MIIKYSFFAHDIKTEDMRLRHIQLFSLKKSSKNISNKIVLEGFFGESKILNFEELQTCSKRLPKKAR